MKKDWTAAILSRTLFPRAEDIRQLTMVLMRMMMAHAKFESQVRALQSCVADDLNFGEQARNQWKARDRAKHMTALIAEKLGQIPETEAIVKLLNDAIAPSDERNFLAHGTWWSFDPQTATISVRGDIQRGDEDRFREYSEKTILGIADRFETLEAELYKLRSDIEKQYGEAHDFD